MPTCNNSSTALGNYQHVSNALGDSSQWLAITEAIEGLESAERKAFEALRRKQFDEAADVLAHAEARDQRNQDGNSGQDQVVFA